MDSDEDDAAADIIDYEVKLKHEGKPKLKDSNRM